MIPIKLALRNFMPYRDNVPPLYFDGIHTASIWGENGNGKSALIDAITWALWGKTRAKSDDDLIHQGQTEMEVEFDFAVGEQTYRVIRKHAKPKGRRASGQSSLDLFIANGDGFKVISGDGIRQTEQKIRDTLHMDYDTFINSAFLRQGHADEFTISNPAKRKQVLTDILGLSVYDELEERAKALARQQEASTTELEGDVKDINDELALKPDYETELQQALGDLSEIEKIIKEQETRLNELRQQRELLNNKQLQLTQLEEHTAATERTLERWNDQIKQHHSRIKEYQEVITRRSTIEEGYTQFITTKRLSEELNQKLRLATMLNDHKHQLEMAIVQSSQVLLKEHALAENKISELATSSRRLPQLKNELQQVQVKLSRLAAEETTLHQKRQTGQELRNHIHHLESNQNRLAQEIEETEAKLNLLSTRTEAKCPLCERELEIEGLNLIKTKYTTDKQLKTDAIKSDQSQLAARETEIKAMEEEIAQLETRLNQGKTAAQHQASLLSQKITETEEADKQLANERAKLTGIEERLARKDFANREQETLHQLEDELTKLGYDSQQHEKVRLHLSDLEQYESPRRKLEEADRLINQEKDTLARAEQAAVELRHSLENSNQQKQALSTELGSFPQLVNDLARAETEHQTLSARQKQAQETVGSVKGKLQRCTELEIKKRGKEKLLNETTKEEKIYKDLAQAFGKTGIQALLIEMALPEIEAEANKLLGRMTDNRMHVKFETQRETKKGDVLETLDIKIADELGTRNYEMFSGGEAFRINFAIRIALSKLLARRAGAPLPTLIIDEGFGTQDNAGLEKIKEAITSIQDDFKKILVITHMEEMRDAFPARIDVIKTAQGSTIEVS